MRPVVKAAAITLHGPPREGYRRLLLIMIDTDGRPENCPKSRAPELVEWAKAERGDTDVACVLPNIAFETWFAAAAESLRGKNGLPEDLTKLEKPEESGAGKGWIKKHLPRKYKEIVDQPRFVGQMDLEECHAASAPFESL